MHRLIRTIKPVALLVVAVALAGLLSGCGTASSPSFTTVVKKFVATPSAKHLRLLEGSKPLVASDNGIYQVFKPFRGYHVYYDGGNNTYGPDHQLTQMVGSLFSPVQVASITRGNAVCESNRFFGERIRVCASAENISPGSLHPLLQVDKLGK